MLKGLKEAWKESIGELIREGKFKGNLGLKDLKGILLGSLSGTLKGTWLKGLKEAWKESYWGACQGGEI